MTSDSPWITETTDNTFEQDVIERSRERPVVVDFWATWCGPCRMLGPILEKLAGEYAGRFQLVKAETDRNQQAAASFNVSSIPAVFAVVNGEVVDYFAGALPEPQLRAWLERLLAMADAADVQRLESTDPAAAIARYRELLAQHPNQPQLQIGLARVLQAQGELDEARKIIDKLEARGFLEPEAQQVKSALVLASQPQGDLATLEAAAAAEPENLDKQLALARALAGAERYEEALQRALSVIQTRRDGPGEEARQLMIDIFRVLPGDSELTGTYRRKLASVLY